MSLKAVISDAIAEQKTSKKDTDLPSLRLVPQPQDRMKNRLRKALKENLADSLLFPEVIEGLVEYLSELLQEDPSKAKLLGVQD